jgi:hypothetical protein
MFWAFLSRTWSGWKEVLVIVQPDTVARWHRKGFRLYWQFISRPGPGRPPIPVEVKTLSFVVSQTKMVGVPERSKLN